MARKAGVPDRSSLRFSAGQVALARRYEEEPAGPLFGELNVLLYGAPSAPEPERWCLIRGGEVEQYWISDLGHLAVWREAPATLWERRGYPQAVVYVDGVKRPRAIHTLVARAFCAWYPGDRVVRHVNSNSRENHVNNLQPGSQAENVLDRDAKRKGIVPTVRPPTREIWKLSPEYAGVRVSNLGRVTLGWWVAFNTSGYFYTQGRRRGTAKHVSVKIVLGGRSRYELLHRLVYEAFVGPIPPGSLVLHRNDDPHDNRLTNLRVGSPAENVADRIRNGGQRFGQAHPSSKYSDAQKGRFLALVGAGLTIREAAEEAGIGIHTARQIRYRLRRGLRVETGNAPAGSQMP